MLRIKEAIKTFNKNRSEGEEKLNQGTLGEIVLKDEDIKRKGWYISMWSRGLQEGKQRPKHIRRICKATNVSADFLLGIESK